jgi:4-phytase/acid phosphatase
LPVTIGGLTALTAAVDPFVMEYAEGLPASQVGWGQLTAAGISQILRLYNLILDLECRTPYLAQLESSNLASHVVRSMVQAATGHATTGSLGNPSTKVILLVASDTNISALASLLTSTGCCRVTSRTTALRAAPWCSNFASRRAPGSISFEPLTLRKLWTSCAIKRP